MLVRGKQNEAESKQMLYFGSKKTTKQHHFELISKFLECKYEKKDLGVIMSTELPWKANNSQKRYQKISKAFYILKRNVSVLINFRSKFIAYVGYVKPVISFNNLVCK